MNYYIVYLILNQILLSFLKLLNIHIQNDLLIIIKIVHYIKVF